MDRTGLPAPYAHQGDSLHVLDPSPLAGCDPSIASRCADTAGYGLGWALMRYRPSPGYAGEMVVWHTGVDAGNRAMVVYFPERRDGAVMFANGADGFQPMIDVGALLFRDTAFADYLRSGRR